MLRIHLIYSEGNIEIFLPVVATLCTDEGRNLACSSRPTPSRQILTQSVQGWLLGPKNKNFTQFRNINVPRGRIACVILTKFSAFVGSIMVGELLKFGDSHNCFTSGWTFSQTFSALIGETICRMRICFGNAKWWNLITMAGISRASEWGGSKKVRCFFLSFMQAFILSFFMSVLIAERQRCANNYAIKR